MDFQNEHTDSDLLRAYRSSEDPKYIGLLYSRYSDLVYGLCLKYLRKREVAQDAVMDIFEKLVTKLKTEEVEFFKSWLYMVSKNHCLMQLRKINPESKADFMEFNLAVHPNEDKMEMDEHLDALEDCLQTLKDEQRACVELFFLQKMSYQQVNEQTNFDLKAVKSYIQNGKRNLKICLEGKHAGK